jgi:hypothetical protein
MASCRPAFPSQRYRVHIFGAIRRVQGNKHCSYHMPVGLYAKDAAWKYQGIEGRRPMRGLGSLLSCPA